MLPDDNFWPGRMIAARFDEMHTVSFILQSGAMSSTTVLIKSETKALRKQPSQNKSGHSMPALP